MENKKIISISIDEKVYHDAKKKCEKNLTKLSTMINHLLKNWIKEG